MPVEVEVPVEAADAHSAVDRELVLEGLLVDDVDHGRDHSRLVLLDLVEERLEPAVGDLDVRVEEDEHVAGGDASAEETRAHQALALVVAQHSHLAAERLVDVDVQRLAEMVHVRVVVDEQDLLEQGGRRPVEDGEDAAQQHRPRLVVEAHDNGDRGQVARVRLVATARQAHVGQRAIERYERAEEVVERVLLPAVVVQVTLGRREVLRLERNALSHCTFKQTQTKNSSRIISLYTRFQNIKLFEIIDLSFHF